MEIPEKLVKLRYHILAALFLGVSLSSLILLAPRFLSLLAYFWPLFLSTALFLAAVLVIGRTSPLPSAAVKPGEDLLDYVAGQPDDAVLETAFQEEDDAVVETASQDHPIPPEEGAAH